MRTACTPKCLSWVWASGLWLPTSPGVKARDCGAGSVIRNQQYGKHLDLRRTMAVYVGIMCGQCNRVFLVTQTSRIKVYGCSRDESLYELTCVPACRATTRFTRADLRVYSVAGNCFIRGYVLRGEYR